MKKFARIVILALLVLFVVGVVLFVAVMTPPDRYVKRQGYNQTLEWQCLGFGGRVDSVGYAEGGRRGGYVVVEIGRLEFSYGEDVYGCPVYEREGFDWIGGYAMCRVADGVLDHLDLVKVGDSVYHDTDDASISVISAGGVEKIVCLPGVLLFQKAR